MDLRDSQTYFGSYDKIQLDTSPDFSRRPTRLRTETEDEIAPWGDSVELQSFKNKLLLSHKPPQKKPELPVASFESVPSKPPEKTKKKVHRRVGSKRIATEGDKDPEGILVDIGNTNKAVVKPYPKLPGTKSGNRILFRTSIQVPKFEKQEKPKEERQERVVKVDRKMRTPSPPHQKLQSSSPPPQKLDYVVENKPTEASEDPQETDEPGFLFPENYMPITRALVSNRIHTANSFFYLPTKQKPSRLRKRESLTRNQSEQQQSRALVHDDSKKSLQQEPKKSLLESTNLIMIRSFRDLHAITTANETDKDALNTYAETVNTYGETLKNRLIEKRLLNPTSKEKISFDSQISGVKTELNDPNKKLTPYGKSNLEKRVGKFFGEKLGKHKEIDDVMRNNLKLKLEILRKINKTNSITQPVKEQENKAANARSSKSSSLSVDIRTSITHPDSIEPSYSLQKFLSRKPVLKTPNVLPMVQERNNYIKSIKAHTNFRESYN